MGEGKTLEREMSERASDLFLNALDRNAIALSSTHCPYGYSATSLHAILILEYYYSKRKFNYNQLRTQVNKA